MRKETSLALLCSLTVFIAAGGAAAAPPSVIVGEPARPPRAGAAAILRSLQSPEDTRVWIAPQLPAVVTAADYFANQDPALDAILSVIGGTGGKAEGELLGAMSLLLASAPAPPDRSRGTEETIRAYTRYCGGGAPIWGRSLCGPLILVDAATRQATASQDPGIAGFIRTGATWTGALPADAGVANTSIMLGKTRFAEILLPLPPDRTERRILLAHESFHRLQPELGFKGTEADNGHLDTKDGRILARLEAAALTAALARTRWRAPARDALAFRAARIRRFPGAGAAEASLLANEGLAEYTGIRVGAAGAAKRWAVRRLQSASARPSLVRSFGYVVGPAYGLLLDRTGKGWRQAALKGAPLPQLLAERIGGPSRRAAPATYGRAAIVAEETARDRQMRDRRSALVAEFEQGPTVTFVFEAMNIAFDPNTMFAFAGQGQVYTRSTAIRDHWGVLQSTGDVLVSAGWKEARVPGPAKIEGQKLSGAGWSAELAPGYEAAPGRRRGDIIVRKRVAAPL